MYNIICLVTYQNEVMNGNNSKDKPWRQCFDKCSDINYNSYVCDQSVKAKEYVNKLTKHHNDPNQYLTFAICKVNKPQSGFRFQQAQFRLYSYIQRYRYRQTKYKFKKYAEKYDVRV